MSKFNVIPSTSVLVLGLSMMFGGASAHASINLAIPNVPLQTGSDVPINLKFIIDDSGSMNWGFLPDDMRYYCKSNSTGLVLAKSKSPSFNKQYYNPEENYIAPPTYSDLTLATAFRNGYKKTDARNLVTNFRATWENNNACGAAGPADYYLLEHCEDTEDLACYQRYDVTTQTLEEQKNFANWYSYYRTRQMSSQAGIARAFVTLPETVRVGYGALKKPSTRGVREFTGTDRTEFFNWLYGLANPSGATPLRGPLKAIGEYFKTNEPYLTVPTDSTSGLVSCRQNFAILMSDGGWNESASPGVGDVDGDGYFNTLADVAYLYWKTDLRTDLPDNVPTATAADANWQHMVTYTVGLGVVGSFTYEEVKDRKPAGPGWTNPGSPTDAGNPGKVDDFIHAAVNSQGGFFSARNPGEFADELTDTLRKIQLRTASATNLAATTTSLQEDNSVFQASFNTKSWSGGLVSRDVGTLNVQWSANFPLWSARNIIASRGNGANPSSFDFEWNNLNATERSVFGNQDVVDFIRGNQAKEKLDSRPEGIFRERTSLLGDIAHSSPVFLGESQNRNLQRYNWSESSSYLAYINSTKTRAPRLYVGANDGMVHSFNANPTDGTAGQETFAYVPQAMLAPGSQLPSFASLDYEHRFFVDGSPTLSDVFIGGSWKTVLVSTLGRGGDWVFALDVTNPADVKVLWDFKVPEVGIMPHKPVITRLNNGKWSVVMGYGYNNSAGKSGLLIIDMEKGPDADIVKLETSSTAAIGLSQVEGWDQNKNGNTDWIFAGDINGNVWKFDLSSSSSTAWSVAYGGNPLFVARDTSSKRQPITGGITLQSHPDTAELWLFFGTGKFIESGDSINADVQSWYGIKDGVAIPNRSQLANRSMTNTTYVNADTAESRTVRTVPVAAANDMDGKRGWVMDLPDSRERITSKPRFVGGNLVMNTTIPDTDLCNPLGDGWIMAVDPFKGSRLNYHFFDLSRDKDFDVDDGVGPDNDFASGLKFSGMPGEPVFVGDQMIVGDSRVSIDSSRVNLQIRRGRLSWREMIN